MDAECFFRLDFFSSAGVDAGERIEAPLKPLGTSQYYHIEGFKRGPATAIPMMPSNTVSWRTIKQLFGDVSVYRLSE